MAKPMIDEFMRARLAEAPDGLQQIDVRQVVLLLLDQYEEAVNHGKWATATALGRVLAVIATSFKD